jgi:hypothetical protein
VWRGSSDPVSRRLWEGGVRIDDFRAPGSLALLSHFHSDHMRGLRRGGLGAPIVASRETALLLRALLRVPPEEIVPIAPGETARLVAGIPLQVTALDANHCPGALMFLIECDAGSLLYTGDFRLDAGMREAVRALPAVDVLIVDNTYDDPRYRFPPQESAIAQVLALVERHHREREVALAIYSIGKTRILEALHARLGRATYVTARTARIYSLLGLGHLVTRDRASTPLRGYGRGYFDRYFKMKREYREGRAVVIIPTGWAVDVRRPEWNYHYVPYSEHCDYREREEFVRLVGPRLCENLLSERNKC